MGSWFAYTTTTGHILNIKKNVFKILNTWFPSFKNTTHSYVGKFPYSHRFYFSAVAWQQRCRKRGQEVREQTEVIMESKLISIFHLTW